MAVIDNKPRIVMCSQCPLEYLHLLISSLNDQGATSVLLGCDDDVFGLEEVGAVVAIGPNIYLNKAKLIANEVFIKSKLVLMPTSLATDSFLTNKYRRSQDDLLTASRSGRYPDAVIIPWSIIQRAPSRANLAGTGEAMAICPAMNDLLTSFCEGVPYSVLYGVADLITWTLTRLKFGGSIDSMLPTIFALLVLKCLIMWAFDDCRWGAGSEHKIAYALGEYRKSPLLHGEACAFGTWLMCSLFFRKMLGPQCLTQLREILECTRLPLTCKAVGIDRRSLPALLRRAKKYRPRRRCYLDLLSDDTFAQLDYYGL